MDNQNRVSTGLLGEATQNLYGKDRHWQFIQIFEGQCADDAVLYMNYNDLRGIVFSETDYSYAQFHGSDLRDTNFNRCKLQSTRFWKSNLAESRFRDADLSDADLVEADLQGADLQNCILQGADLRRANLEGVKGLTVDQVQSANNWKEAIYDTNFLILLGSNEKSADE